VTYEVIFNPEARNDLFNLYQFIAERGFPDRAANYIHRLEEFCRTLRTFPQRGTSLDHLRPGLRVVSFERRVSIAFQITADSVVIFRVLCGGRDVENLFSPER
jgi:toxin ParE1/3/4